MEHTENVLEPNKSPIPPLLKVFAVFQLRILKYYFSKGFVMLELNSNKLKRIVNETKQIIHEMDMHDSDYVMTCTTAISFISNTLKKLLLHSYSHIYYIQTKYNGREEIINNIFSKYVVDDLLSTIIFGLNIIYMRI